MLRGCSWQNPTQTIASHRYLPSTSLSPSSSYTLTWTSKVQTRREVDTKMESEACESLIPFKLLLFSTEHARLHSSGPYPAALEGGANHITCGILPSCRATILGPSERPRGIQGLGWVLDVVCECSPAAHRITPVARSCLHRRE
jgi:hypothetical protein